jgi:SPW repeat-containing protein
MYWITGILGLAMGVAPWVFNYADNTNAMWASVIIGAAMVLVSFYKGIVHDSQNWEYWVAGIAGIVAVAAPFVLNFTALTEALWTSIVVGVLLILISGYEVFFAPPETT